MEFEMKSRGVVLISSWGRDFCLEYAVGFVLWDRGVLVLGDIEFTKDHDRFVS